MSVEIDFSDIEIEANPQAEKIRGILEQLLVLLRVPAHTIENLTRHSLLTANILGIASDDFKRGEMASMENLHQNLGQFIFSLQELADELDKEIK